MNIVGYRSFKAMVRKMQMWEKVREMQMWVLVIWEEKLKKIPDNLCHLLLQPTLINHSPKTQAPVISTKLFMLFYLFLLLTRDT